MNEILASITVDSVLVMPRDYVLNTACAAQENQSNKRTPFADQSEHCHTMYYVLHIYDCNSSFSGVDDGVSGRRSQHLFRKQVRHTHDNLLTVKPTDLFWRIDLSAKERIL